MNVQQHHINVQARAFLPLTLEYLENLEAHPQVEASIFPLYNGRERGYVVTIWRNRKGGEERTVPALVIFFAEHRNSDHLFLWHWLDTRPGVGMGFNAPTIDCASAQAAYDKRMTVPEYRFDQAMGAFRRMVEQWLIEYT